MTSGSYDEVLPQRRPVRGPGCRSELTDPDGYVVRLWDERTMKDK
jgi:hypothetical protein